jgi:Flp pilus assembly protein CpaB
MSRRARAIGFASAAIACAGMAAAIAGGYRTDLESQLGRLRPVIVARGEIPPHRRLRLADVSRLLEIRRIPERFTPPGALTTPQQAVGRAPTARISAGSYVLGSQLRSAARPRHAGRPRIGAGRKPVDISVSGAEALAAVGGNPEGNRVDVIVTTEPGPGGGSGRTYVAAEGVELIALGQSGDSGVGEGLSGPGVDTWTATLALTRPQALRLIQAQNFARQVRLIPG